MATEVQYGVACPPSWSPACPVSATPVQVQPTVSASSAAPPVGRPTPTGCTSAASWRITVRRAVASWRIPSGLSVRRRPPDRFFPWTTPNHIQIQPAARTTDGKAGRARSSRDLEERELPGQVGQPDRTCRLAETRF